MSNGEDVNVLLQDIKLVKNFIEQCMRSYMSRKEVVNLISVQAKIEPRVVEVVWKRLEEENPEFFRAYLLRLSAIKQINKFNNLLERQVELMPQRYQSGVASTIMSQRSYIPPMHQISAGPVSMQENKHGFFGTGLPMRNAVANCGPSLHSPMHDGADMSVHARRIDVSQNMPLGQGLNVGGMVQDTNVGMVKSERGYADRSHFMCGGDQNFLEMCPAVGDACNVEYDPQPKNDTLVETGTSFQNLDYISQNFSFPELADFPDDFVADAELFRDLHGGEEYQGENEILDTAANGSSYGDLSKTE